MSIDIGNRKNGPHVLTPCLASSMVNDDISYETVRKVLGHSSNNAIKHYARIDVEKLREYCLEPPEASRKFKAFLQGEVVQMPSEFKSFFCDEIELHLMLRKEELCLEAFRHYKHTVNFFDDYLYGINHTEKTIDESIVDGWIKEVSNGISINTVSQHVHYIRQLLLFLIGNGYYCLVPKTIMTRDTYVPHLYTNQNIENIFKTADSFTASRAVKNIYILNKKCLCYYVCFSAVVCA